MKVKKAAFLFLALLLPVFIFLFLKFFGKNEFAVRPLYNDVSPVIQQGCDSVTIPYRVSSSIVQQLKFSNDSLCLIWFGKLSNEGTKQYTKILEKYKDDPLMNIILENEQSKQWAKCVFFLTYPFDMALVDKQGLIRGQYVSNDREEIDRLKIEIDIILKKY